MPRPRPTLVWPACALAILLPCLASSAAATQPSVVSLAASGDDDHHGSGRVLAGDVRFGDGVEGEPIPPGDGGAATRVKLVEVDPAAFVADLVDPLPQGAAIDVEDTNVGAHSIEFVLLDGNSVIVQPVSARVARLPVMESDLRVTEWLTTVEWLGQRWDGDHVEASASMSLIRSEGDGWRVAGVSVSSSAGEYVGDASVDGVVALRLLTPDPGDTHHPTGSGTPNRLESDALTPPREPGTPAGGPEHHGGPLAAPTNPAPVLDLVAIFDPAVGAARAATFFSSQVAFTNQAMTNSIPSVGEHLGEISVTPRIRLVGIVVRNGRSTGDFLQDLRELSNPDPAAGRPTAYGRDIRAALGADLVSYAVLRPEKSDQPCGIAWRGPTTSIAFSVVNAGSTELGRCPSSLVLAHEIGHNLGAAHDPADPDSHGHFADSVGHCAAEGHDVMATSCASSTDVEYPNYSNPYVNLAGTTMPSGTLQHFSARVIHYSAEQLAGIGSPTQISTQPSRYTALSRPIRILDTRPGGDVADAYDTPWQATEVRVVTAAGTGSIPLGTTSVMVNITVTNPSANGYLTAFPYGSARPETSTTNFVAGQTRSAGAFVPIDAFGRMWIYTQQNTEVIVDVFGYTSFATSSGTKLTPISPTRVLDEPLPEGGYRVIPIAGASGLPASGVTAVIANVTAEAGPRAGYVTATSEQTPPLGATSVLNYAPGETTANLAVIPVDTTTGTISVRTLVEARVVVDIQGYFATGGMYDYTPVIPTRIYGVRWDTEPAEAALAGGVERQIAIRGAGPVPTSAKVVLVNITGGNPTLSAYLTL